VNPPRAECSRAEGPWLCGGFGGDREAEGFEPAHVVAFPSLGVDAGVVEVGAEVVGSGFHHSVPADFSISRSRA
jgi:hypothetical protein